MSETILTIAKIVATAGMVFPLAVLLCRYFKMRRPEIRLSGHRTNGAMAVSVLGAFLVTRLFCYTVALIGAAAGGNAVSYLQSGAQPWIHWDAYHYIGLIRNWYVNEGDPRFHIVFYPLFPLLGRCLNAFLFDAEVSGFIVANAALLAAGCGFYRLSEERGYDPDLCVWTLMLLPASFYFSVPYSESVFLCCTVFCALAASRKKYAAAILFGALATFARALGAVCAVLIFYEYLCDLSESAGQADNRKKYWIFGILKAFFNTCLILLGFAAYLLINYRVTGDPFRFLTYQKEHWGQEFGSLWNTVGYTLDYAFTYYDLGYRVGVWIPQIVSIFLVIGLMCVSCFRIHPADGAFAIVYLYCAVAPTWLLSGPRYLFAMYPVVYLATVRVKGRTGKVILFTLEAAMAAYCAYMYAVKGCLL